MMAPSMLLGLGACNNEDDVMEIFNNKTWNGSYRHRKRKRTILSRACGATKVKKKSTVNSILWAKGNYTLNFNCAEVNGEVTGTVNVHAVNSDVDSAV